MLEIIKVRFGSIIKDFSYNIAASILLTAVMQLVLYPFLAWHFTGMEYGKMLTMMGITNTFTATFGGALNNVRLILNAEYDGGNVTGDYNLLSVIMGGAASSIIFLAASFSFHESLFNCVSLAVITFLGIVVGYLTVYFRLILDFKRVLWFSIVGATGYLVGILILLYCSFWTIPFLTAQIIQAIYVFHYGKLQEEAFGVSERLPEILGKLIILVLTALSGNIMAYLDRFIIFPLLGGDAVSNYSVASYFGKALGIMMTPIAGVLLGYYSQKGYQINGRSFWAINAAAMFIGVLFIAFSVPTAPIFTRFFYPTVYSGARNLILVANVAATIGVVCSMTQVAILKFAPTWLQMVKELAYGFVYMGAGLVLIERYGLLGFCIAAILANTAKLLVLYIIGYIYI